jgi:hypothetical protein
VIGSLSFPVRRAGVFIFRAVSDDAAESPGLSAYDAGMVLAPRGLGHDARDDHQRPPGRASVSNFSIMIAGGFMTNAIVTMWVMSHLSLHTDTTPIVWWGFILGFWHGLRVRQR